MAINISTENLAYWFFRLNGFLSIVNFVVHHNRRGESGTDVDLLGVRFPFRAEIPENPMKDFHVFDNGPVPYIAFIEVKRGRCALNGPWTEPQRGNMHLLLHALGAFPITEINDVAEALYSKGNFQDKNYYATLLCVGEEKNNDLNRSYPAVPQILWSEITAFIYDRFHAYRNQKAWHQHWYESGRELFSLYTKSQSKQEFIENLHIIS